MDPREPLVLSTHDLGRRPGAMRRVQRVVPAPADLGVELVGVEEGSDLSLDLRLEAVLEGVLVSGDVRAVAVGECGRCLGSVVQPVTAHVQDLYVYPGHESPEGEDEDVVRRLDGDLIDLEPALRDAIITALPFQPLCRPDCPGLCPVCGARLADVPEPHRHEGFDPRWAALRGLSAAEPRGSGTEGADGPAPRDGGAGAEA